MSMRASVNLAVAVMAVATFATPASAQWVAGCGRQLEITVENQTPHACTIKLNGVAVQTVQPGGHLHILHPHGSFQLEAQPVNGGPRFSQRMEMHGPVVWHLRIPASSRAQEPE